MGCQENLEDMSGKVIDGDVLLYPWEVASHDWIANAYVWLLQEYRESSPLKEMSMKAKANRALATSRSLHANGSPTSMQMVNSFNYT